MRFLINSTVGIGGVFDVAKDWGYPSHGTDFGVTLALWGVPSGPFLFLPVLGPTDPRDAGGFGVDIALDPFTWVGQGAAVTALGWSRYAVSAVDGRERVLDDVDRIKRTALDPYATFRSLYRQHRKGEIEDTRNDNRATVPAWFPAAGRSARCGVAEQSPVIPVARLQQMSCAAARSHGIVPAIASGRDPMLTRRTQLFLAGLALGLAFFLGVPPHARAQGADAVSFVRQTGDALVKVVNGTAPEPAKRQDLQQIVDRTVDVDGIARFALGRFGVPQLRSSSRNTCTCSTRCC